jgi:signal transduction histidine kinase
MWLPGDFARPRRGWITVLGLVACAALAALGTVEREAVLLISSVALGAAIVRLAHQVGDRERLAESLRQGIDHERDVRDRLVRSVRRAAAGELASGIAHEVNNPLTSILGYTELLLAESQPGSTQRADLEVVRDEAVRARGIVRALVDFARPRPPERVPVDLVDLVVGAVELVRARAVAQDIQVEEAYAQLPALQLDPAAIHEAVTNVLSNALAALPHGGTLGIRVGREGRDAVIRVEDNGLGMDEETRERALLPFFSLAGGRGLGLSVALGLVEAHGGSISLSGASPAGTVAEIRLPILEAQILPAASEAVPASAAA